MTCRDRKEQRTLARMGEARLSWPGNVRLRVLAVVLTVLAAACVGAKPKPAEPGLGPAPVAASAPSPGPAADSLRIYLMTFGPGADVWEHFGHTAIWVHDPARGTDQAYNYGMFDFQQAHFYRRLLEGKMLYWMQGFDANLFADAYIQQDRSIWIQELALTPPQREALRRFLLWNELPENRFYGYDYFRDGCATRVRDALDRVLGGRIYAQTARVPSGSTYRSHSLKLVEDDPWAYTGITLGLGEPTDRPISLWEEMFLPLKLQETLRRVTVPAPDGRMVPLVASERTVYASTRPPEPAEPPERAWMYLVIGLAVAFVLGGLAELVRRTGPDPRERVGSGPARAPEGRRDARDRSTGRDAPARPLPRNLAARSARWALAGMAVSWSLVTGVFGLVILLLWTATAHVTSHNNENVLQFDALALALVVLAPAAIFGVAWARRTARFLALTIAALSLLGLLFKATPWFPQDNLPIIALALPANLGLAWAMWRVTDGAGRPRA